MTKSITQKTTTKQVQNLKNNFLSCDTQIKYFTCLLILLFSSIGWGQQVTLTATSGTASGTFTTLKGAFDAINAGTHQGAIVISINANTTETAPCVLNSTGAGSATYTSVLIQPTADGLTVSGATVTGRGLIELNGADNVTIDGDNPNTTGTNRNLTITNTAASTITHTSCVRIAVAATVVTSANNNTIRNLIVNGSATGLNTSATTSSSGSGNGSYGIYAGGNASTVSVTTAPSAITSVSTTVGTGATYNNLVISNNEVNACARAIYVGGSAVTVCNALTISNNVIGSATPNNTTTVYSIGITAQGCGNGIISGNKIRSIESWIATSLRGIDVGSMSAVSGDLFKIIDNSISNIVHRASTSSASYGVYGINITGGTGNTISNNLIFGLNNCGSGLSTSFGCFGIRIGGNTNHKIYHNSINLSSTNITTLGAYHSACLAITSSGLTGLDVRNNIFSNTSSSNGQASSYATAIYLPSSATSTMNLTLNNNAYYTGSTAGLHGVLAVGTTYAAPYTVANFSAGATTPTTNSRSYTGPLSAAGTNDNASLAYTSAAPFVSATDLHISTGTTPTLLESWGVSTSVTSVTTDVDGNTRPGPSGSTNGGGIAPDLGADEFDGVPVLCTTPTSIAASVTSTAQTFTSISGSFTAASVAPTGYIVVRTSGNTQPTPSTGTTYSVGNNAIGFIEYVGTSAGSWTSTGLSTGTTYYYWVFSYNFTNGSCLGPVYSASSSTLSQSTPACSGPSLNNLTYSLAPAIYCTNNAITTNAASLGTTNGSVVYSVTPALPSGLSLNSSTGSITGTPTTAQSATSYTITAENGCTNTQATVSIEIVTSPTAPTSLAATVISIFGFTANWTTNGADSYILDVATDASFANLVSGFNGFNVGNVATYSVTGLNAGNTYFYRVRAVSGSCISANSSSQTVTTTAITSSATGNWDATTTWSSGTIPTCGDIITIASTHNVTINSASNVSKNLTIASGGTLTIASGDLTVGCTLNNTPLTNNGTLTVSGGTLNVNGNINSILGSVFNQSGGDINIDGNNGGSTTGSVASGTPLLNLLQLNSGINWTGGTLTIVDPHTATINTSGYALYYSNLTTGTNYPLSGHTFRFGNGTSTDAGGNTSGFYVDNWYSSALIPFGSCVINGPSGTNRLVSIAYPFFQSNVSINSGGTLIASTTTAYVFGGDISVNLNGIFTANSTLQTGLITANTSSTFTASPTTNSQQIGGNGTYKNLTTSPTANLTNLAINNTSAGGVTISTPLSISGTLTMSAGKINTTATNLLTLGISTAAGTLSYTAGQIVGPFARTFATSSTSTASYDATTLFPVGDGTNYTPIHIDPVNGAGPVVMRGQAFNTNSGSAGIGMASPLSNDRWEALATSGSSNLTSCFVGLNDAQIATGNVIAQSASAAGFYNAIAPVSTVAAGASIRTATAIPAASYTGFFTYGSPSVANTWTGTASNLWSTAGNWSLTRVPTATDDVLISSDGSNPPVMDVDVTIPAGKSLTLSGTGSLTVAPGKVLTITGTANFGGMPVTFKSDATGTAMLGTSTGNLSGATNVKVERYIPLGKRAFRLLSPAVTTTTFISGNWQEQTHITGGLGATGLGFDATETNNPSMYTYDNQAAQGVSGWTPIPNTNNTNLIAGVGYRVLIRGDKTSTNITSASANDMNAAITLSATGTLKTGTVPLSLSSTPSINNTTNSVTNGYSLVGNPYQSAVDWHLVTRTGIEDTYYAWAPNMGTGAARGNYVAYDVTSGNSGGGLVDRYIQPGQAFFVKNTGSTAGTLTFEEADKATTSANVFRTANTPSFGVALYDPNELAIGGYPIDATKAVFSSDYSNELGLGDAAKLEAAGENIAWFRNNTKLAIDAAAPVTTSDELAMKTIRLGANKNYTFKFQTTNFDNALTPYLVDTFLNTQTEIATSQAFLASFATTSNQASFSEDRFKIVFQTSALSADDFVKNIKLYPNPAKAGGSFYIDGITEATVSVYNVVGQTIPVTVMSQGNAIQVTPSASLSNGVYLVSITTQGITKQVKWIVE